MIDSEFIKEFCLEHFKSDYRLSSDGFELIIPSIFVENDYKRHLSINLETGLWQCFKTGQRGNFFKLYSHVTGVSYKAAYETFMFDAFIEGREEVEDIEVRKTIDFDAVADFVKLDTNKVYDDPMMALASETVHSRGMADFEFYVCLEGFYKHRLIIPYKDSNNKLFFFQGRSLDGWEPKYLNCKSIKSSWVLYPFDYESNAPLFITEGAFDCMALRGLGLNATSTVSCQTSNEQMKQLRHYSGRLVVAFDRDEAGIHGLKQFVKMANKYKRSDCSYIFPKEGFKDWNELILSCGEDEALFYLHDRKELDRTSVELIEL